MKFEEIPGRVFLDTSSLNFILEYGEHIFDGMSSPTTLSKRIINDIEAFYNIFLTGKRASWQLAISPFTYKEIIETQDATKKYYLENWFMDVWHCWLNILDQNDDLPSFLEAEHARIKLLSSGILNILPDIEDRILICDAVVYRCDCFCTRDWRTILKYRDYLKSLPIKILTPSEWWDLIKSYAGLWV
ncbi:MAG TPA: hypothetical protein ENI34_06100 [candidate division WOR-3 bacterium]|uniref:PIN domain-containing protein n=1 Tax=candidate division WOR-3 bacterium TaxID=2052148 RepID=A0A9C9EMA2_UNCW3|nr:hypothetical protein [candidate division WOR-3 bacterium]